MTIEFLIYPALVFLAATLIAKLVERQRDVLYGPYIQGRKTAFEQFRDQLNAFMNAIGLRRGYSRMVVKFAPVGILASAIVG
jgi:hypothetical protein